MHASCTELSATPTFPTTTTRMPAARAASPMRVLVVPFSYFWAISGANSETPLSISRGNPEKECCHCCEEEYELHVSILDIQGTGCRSCSRHWDTPVCHTGQGTGYYVGFDLAAAAFAVAEPLAAEPGSRP